MVKVLSFFGAGVATTGDSSSLISEILLSEIARSRVLYFGFFNLLSAFEKLRSGSSECLGLKLLPISLVIS